MCVDLTMPTSLLYMYACAHCKCCRNAILDKEPIWKGNVSWVFCHFPPYKKQRKTNFISPFAVPFCRSCLFTHSALVIVTVINRAAMGRARFIIYHRFFFFVFVSPDADLRSTQPTLNHAIFNPLTPGTFCQNWFFLTFWCF